MNSLLYWCHGVFIKPDYRCLHLVKTLISTVHCYFPCWCSGSRPFSLLIEWWLGQSHSHIITFWLAAWWPQDTCHLAFESPWQPIADWHSSSAWRPQHIQKHAWGLGLRYSCSTHIDFTPLNINVDVFNLRRHISDIILHLRASDRQRQTETEERMLTEFSWKPEPTCRLPKRDDGKLEGHWCLKGGHGKTSHDEPSTTLCYIYVKHSIDFRQSRQHIKFDVNGRETVK